jgi:rhodanese-related sulfurtransferase
MMHFNKKTYLEIIIIISISISGGIIKNLTSKEPLPLFSKYNLKLLEKSLYETRSFNVNNPIEIDAEGVMHLYENNLAFLIDIRSLIKYKNGHIPTSLSLGKNLNGLNSLSLSNSNKIIIILSDESSNKLISKFYLKLTKKGVRNIFVYKKGIEDWIENGFPMKKSNSQK